MQVLADEDLLAIVMDNLDDPKTLFNLVLALPTAKAIFERCPVQLLTAALSGLPSEIQLLAVLYIVLKQHDVSQASIIPFLWKYLRLEDSPGIMEPQVAATAFAIPRHLGNPFETLRELAAVWSAVEDLADGFIERSIKLIQTCQAAKDSGLETVHYAHGHKLRPLSHLWDREIKLEGVPGYQTLYKPQPWSLPLRASEVHRVKRALWRIEIFAVISNERCTFPNESATAGLHCADAMGPSAMPPDHDEGTRMLLASLEGSELAELESVYAYLWCETIGKAYQHKLDEFLPRYDEDTQRLYPEENGETTSSNSEYWDQEYERFRAQVVMKMNAESTRKEHDRYLTYLMSLGLPFLHRVHQQMARDCNKIIPENYPPLRYQSLNGLRDTWNKMDRSRCDNIWRSYDTKLVHVNADNSVTRRSAVWTSPEDYPGSGAYTAYGAMYLQSRYSSNQFCIDEVWRAGCYMWERGK